MSIEFIRAEIERFLSDERPEVICISGKWGVGKTFAWNKFFREAQAAKKVSLSKYVYVSLFGIESLEDLKATIVENTVDSSIVNAKPDFSSIRAISQRLIDGAKQAGAEISKASKHLPIGSNYVLSANRILFSLTSRQIVCFDDLERAGSKIDARSVMGIASLLKEEKSCKVVILLNQDELDVNTSKDFGKNLEKVADIVLRFEPTAAEAAEIAVTAEKPYSVDLKKCIQQLNITNIRVIKRAENFCAKIFELAKDTDEHTRRQIVRVVTLATYAKFQPEVAPSLKFIENYNSIADIVSKEKKTKTSEEERYSDQLRAFHFSGMTSFDKIFINAINIGVIEPDIIERDVVHSTKRARESFRKEQFYDIWKDLHNNFDENEQHFLSRLAAGAREFVDVINGSDLSSVVEFLKEFGRVEDARSILNLFMNVRTEPAEFWSNDQMRVFQRISDPEVRDAFEKRYKLIYKPPTLREILIQLAEKNGWNDEYLDIMNASTKDQYKKLFKSSSKEDFHQVIAGALFFRKTVSHDVRLEQITGKVIDALKEIAEESLLNARRVKLLLGE